MLRLNSILLAGVVILALIAVPLAGAAGADAGPFTANSTTQSTVEHNFDDPDTTTTIGYVEGYSYDDELPVDDRTDAVVDEDELEAVVYRSMARVEVIRELPFEEDVSVDVMSREEYRERNDELFAEFDEEEAFFENLRLEALFLADRETDATDEVEAMYGDAVAGYYDIENDQVVVVADDPDEPEVDEITLGHELLHALQDQYFDLGSYDRSTQNLAHAKNGLIEGDARYVDTEYEDRCRDEWECLPSPTSGGGPTDFNWGLFYVFYQPYVDGPPYVEYHLAEGGWEAVDALYDDPPSSASEVMRPDEERERVDLDLVERDRSSDAWEPFEVDGEPAAETFGEATMATMFVAGAFDNRESVIDADEFRPGGTTVEYEHPETDGWAGDEFLLYVPEGVTIDGESDTDALDNAGYVWETAWLTEADAAKFADAYRELLEINGGETIEEDIYEIDEGFAGVYHVDHDGESVTIVRAPTAEDLSEIDGSLEDDTVDGSDGDGITGAIPGFTTLAAALAILMGTALAIRRQ